MNLDVADAVAQAWPSAVRLARLRANAGRVRLGLAVECPWLTLLPYRENTDQFRGWTPFQLPLTLNGMRFAQAIRAERLPVAIWQPGTATTPATLAFPISAGYTDEETTHLPLAVAKVAAHLQREAEAAGERSLATASAEFALR